MNENENEKLKKHEHKDSGSNNPNFLRRQQQKQEQIEKQRQNDKSRSGSRLYHKRNNLHLQLSQQNSEIYFSHSSVDNVFDAYDELDSKNSPEMILQMPEYQDRLRKSRSFLLFVIFVSFLCVVMVITGAVFQNIQNNNGESKVKTKSQTQSLWFELYHG